MNGIRSLNAGAPDLRLTGDQTQRGTYTQRRRDQMAGGGRTQMAYGGIPGADGRRAYGIGSIFQKYIKDPIEMLITGKTPQQLEQESQARVKEEDRLYGEGYENPLDTFLKGSPVLDELNPLKGDQRTGGALNYLIPMGIGAAAGKMQEKYLADQPPFPADKTGITFQTAQEAMADPTLRFKPQAQYANVAEGGRIGYNIGGITGEQNAMVMDMLNRGMDNDVISTITGVTPEDIQIIINQINEAQKGLEESGALENLKAQGGRIGAQEGGLMNLGGMEKDYSQEGGFVPIGGEEKADDVPARLSKNEFVFTADAVRAAGGGDIDAGAEVMENLMENLEAGGKVSEESQGLEGAREMFANAQALEKRII